jgi:hypothetical protein
MLRLYTHSEAGGHVENQDAFAVRAHTSAPDVLVGAVADGQGGQAGGAAASQLAVQSCIALLTQAQPASLLAGVLWSQILSEVDGKVARHKIAGYTTFVAFCLTSEIITGASSGDSAALVIDSQDSSESLTHRQLKNPPMGSGLAIFVPFFAKPLRPWKFLAMTDGVSKYAGWNAIRQTAASLSGNDVITALHEQAALPGGLRLQDDFTVVLVEDDGT